MSEVPNAHGSRLIPSCRYRDAVKAMEWLETVFGFHRHAVYHGQDGAVSHAELTLGEGMLMLGSAANASPYGRHLAVPDEMAGRVSSVMYLVLPDCESIYARAQEQGAEVVQPLADMEYGGKGFTVRDPEGHLWSAGEYDPWTASHTATELEG